MLIRVQNIKSRYKRYQGGSRNNRDVDIIFRCNCILFLINYYFSITVGELRQRNYDYQFISKHDKKKLPRHTNVILFLKKMKKQKIGMTLKMKWKFISYNVDPSRYPSNYKYADQFDRSYCPPDLHLPEDVTNHILRIAG